jgi:hypothetical protein
MKIERGSISEEISSSVFFISWVFHFFEGLDQTYIFSIYQRGRWERKKWNDFLNSSKLLRLAFFLKSIEVKFLPFY